LVEVVIGGFEGLKLLKGMLKASELDDRMLVF